MRPHENLIGEELKTQRSTVFWCILIFNRFYFNAIYFKRLLMGPYRLRGEKRLIEYYTSYSD